MIKTLTLNPAVDKAVTIEKFAVGKVNRIATVRLDAGGKGLNVARILHHSGAQALAVAPVAGSAGTFLENRLTEEGIPHRFIRIDGETRTNLKVVDPVLGTHTDINEPGPALSADDLARLEALFLGDLQPGDWVVFSGSVPGGVAKNLYGLWIAQARQRGALTVLDADGELFAQGLAGQPDLIKPNKAELEGWLGRTIDTDEALFEAVRALRSAGARSVAVSLGGDGAWLFHGEGAWHVNGLKVEAKSTVGAGDALLGALTAGLAAGRNPGEALARAAATATASVVRAGTGFGDPKDIEAFLARLAVRHQPFPGRKS